MGWPSEKCAVFYVQSPILDGYLRRGYPLAFPISRNRKGDRQFTLTHTLPRTRTFHPPRPAAAHLMPALPFLSFHPGLESNLQVILSQVGIVTALTRRKWLSCLNKTFVNMASEKQNDNCYTNMNCLNMCAGAPRRRSRLIGSAKMSSCNHDYSYCRHNKWNCHHTKTNFLRLCQHKKWG